MKLLRVEFQNFRLLRDLELRFASGPDRNLTVIRAANESGKTTILHALQWALYGDIALPDKGEDFRLHPIDWDAGDGKRVPVTATVDFEVTTYGRMPDGLRETRSQYRLVRSTSETLEGLITRAGSTVKLFVLSEKGASEIDSPEALIKDELPLELREVFFTDGDRALSFIEADVALSTKRDRVQRGIRSLLGLGVIEDAIKHVRKSSAEVNRKAKFVARNNELKDILSHLEAIDEQLIRLENEVKDAGQQFSVFDEKLNETDRKIAAALQKGDKEQLRKNIDKVRREIKQFDGLLAAANKEHSELFRGSAIATDLLSSILDGAYRNLEELHDQGKIPTTTIPVLQERLSTRICICGETLDAEDSQGKRRRDHIRRLIDDSRRADEIQEIITDLYYGAKPSRPGESEGRSSWLEDYKKVIQQREDTQGFRDEAGRRYRALEQQLDALPDTDIAGLRATSREYKEQRDRCLSKKVKGETQLADFQNQHKNFESKRDRLLREQQRGTRLLAEVEVTRDILTVLQSAFTQITNEELAKVSESMNGIFLRMIGSDPEQGAVIQRAEISRDFDIIVHGPNDRRLNPDRDLNGASRRALTFAFILALTKVSEVEAPNVIDTPLGMTSGYVKRSILRAAIQESKQLVLFLTHDEITGCEDILDEAAGAMFTLTNPRHYPKMLVNDPHVSECRVLRCECNHRSECRVCQRHKDEQVDVDLTL